MFALNFSYILTDIELSILLSTLIYKSGDSNSKLRLSIKGFYQSIVGCADRSKVVFSFFLSVDDSFTSPFSQRIQLSNSTNHPNLLPRDDSLPGSETGPPRQYYSICERGASFEEISTIDG